MAVINKNTQKLLEDRYFFKNVNTGEVIEKTAEEMFMRVAKTISKAEKTPELQEEYEKIFYDVMDQQLFMPNTPTLIGAGYNKCLSACSVLPNLPDNLEGIYKHMWHNAKLTKYGCGVGQSLSNIRPKGEIIKSSGGTSAGVVNWMNLINAVANTTIQGDKARRAANMAGLRFNHPDIFDFIHSKENDGNLSTMNISVTITDEEMYNVVNDDNINLIWDGKIYKTVKAREIFNEIINGLWENGEPGILWIDSINNTNPFNLQDGDFNNSNKHYMSTTNPCFTGDMRLLTTDGYRLFSELNSKTIQIINSNGDISEGSVWCSGEKDVIQLSLSNKKKIKCTPDHIFKLNNNEDVKAKDTLGKRLISYYGTTNNAEDLFVKLGFIQGDGGIGRINSERHLGLEVNIGYKDKEILDLFNVTKIKEKRAYYLNGYNDLLIQYGFDGSPLPERVFPITYTSWMKYQRANFLKGCYSANGSIIKNHRIAYKTTSKVFSLQLKKALEEFGIIAYITTNKPTNVKFANGDYLCKESYDINISRLDDVIVFYQKIGFMQQYKIDNLIGLIKVKSPKVRSIKTLSKEFVYDFNEPSTNWGVVEGVTVHNCGEQPLEPNEFCNLGSVNLENLYDKKTRDINWILFEKVIKTAIRFLDDVIDVNEYVLPEFKDNVLANRKIGVGVAGWANLLIKMGIRYDSEECLKFIDKVFGFKQKVEKEYNIELALEKGNFPSWSESIFAITNTPARCATISTQAPTGSIAGILNTIAYGVEPLFGVAVLRTIVTGAIYEASELFATMLHSAIKDEAKEQEIIKECYIKGTAQINSVPKKLRELFRCANDISPEWHIKTQAQFQKYYDNAISKTINAPENATKDELFELLIKAWEMGVKGVTYYRNNSRKNQTMQIGDSNKNNHNIKLDSIQPISRSSIGKTYGVTDKYITACGSFYLTINRDPEGNIVESFVNTSKNGTCKSNIDGLNRMISLALRSGTKIDEIVDQLKGITCAACTRVKTKGDKKINGLSCPDIIAKALEGEYRSQTKIISENIDIIEEVNENGCPECKSPMNLAEGCSVCSNPDCGYSKCG